MGLFSRKKPAKTFEELESRIKEKRRREEILKQKQEARREEIKRRLDFKKSLEEAKRKAFQKEAIKQAGISAKRRAKNIYGARQQQGVNLFKSPSSLMPLFDDRKKKIKSKVKKKLSERQKLLRDISNIVKGKKKKKNIAEKVNYKLQKQQDDFNKLIWGS